MAATATARPSPPPGIRQSVASKTYDVHLDPALRKGETTTISVLQVLHDSGERFESFLAKSVHEPIQALTLRVELPLDLLPDRAWRITREGSGPQARVVDRHEVPVGDLVPRSRTDPNATFEWHVPRPAVGRNYALHWSYVDDRGLYNSNGRCIPRRCTGVCTVWPDNFRRLPSASLLGRYLLRGAASNPKEGRLVAPTLQIPEKTFLNPARRRTR